MLEVVNCFGNLPFTLMTKVSFIYGIKIMCFQLKHFYSHKSVYSYKVCINTSGHFYSNTWSMQCIVRMQNVQKGEIEDNINYIGVSTLLN